MWKLYFTKQAQKDARKLASSGLKTKAQQLLTILQSDPWQNPPPFEKLVGDLSGAYSRRINIQHRLVYQVSEPEKVVKILRLWPHYEWPGDHSWSHQERDMSGVNQQLMPPDFGALWVVIFGDLKEKRVRSSNSLRYQVFGSGRVSLSASPLKRH